MKSARVNEATPQQSSQTTTNIDGGSDKAFRQVMQSLLRRFVDHRWLARRWGEEVELGSPALHPKGSNAADSAEYAGAAASGELPTPP
jgi:hypothetical protein